MYIRLFSLTLLVACEHSDTLKPEIAATTSTPSKPSKPSKPFPTFSTPTSSISVPAPAEMCPTQQLRELCANGLDDNGDGQTDCVIEGLVETPTASFASALAWSTDLFDINGDGIIDMIPVADSDDGFDSANFDVLLGPFIGSDQPVASASGVSPSEYVYRGYVDDFDSDGQANFMLHTIDIEDGTALDGFIWQDLASDPQPTSRLGAPPDSFSGSFWPVGDLNDNGTPDMAVYSRKYSSNILYNQMMLVDGADVVRDGTADMFAYATIATQDSLWSPRIGDMTGDGRDDLALVISNDSGGALFVFDAPSGEIVPSLAHSTITLPDQWIWSHAWGSDLNGDDAQDLLLMLGIQGSSGLFVLPGPLPSGPSVLADLAWASYSPPTNGSTFDTVYAGDLNGDGYADIAMRTDGLDDRLWIDYNPCAGERPLPPDAIALGSGSVLGLGELSGDGVLDVAIARWDDPTVALTQVFAGGSKP